MNIKKLICWFFPVFFPLLISVSLCAAEKKLKCENVRQFVSKEGLRTRIFVAKEVFPLKEVAENDQGAENKENEKCWKEKDCCDKEKGCAQQLGELFAEILLEEENNDEKLLKLLKFISETLTQFHKSEFKTASRVIYNSFVKALHTGDYKRVREIIKIQDFGYEIKTSELAMERFAVIQDLLRKSRGKSRENTDKSEISDANGNGASSDAEINETLENILSRLDVHDGKFRETKMAEKKLAGNKVDLLPFVILVVIVLLFVTLSVVSYFIFQGELNEMYDKFNTMNKHVGDRLGTAENQIRDMSVQKDAVTKRMDRLNRRMDLLEGKINDLENSMKQAPAVSEEFQENGKVSEQMTDSLEEKFHELKKSVQQVQKDIETLSMLTGDIVRLNEKIEQVQIDMADMADMADSGQIGEHGARGKIFSDKDALISAITEMEHAVLTDKWDGFKKDNKELVLLAAKVRDSEEKRFYLQEVRVNLPRLLEGDEELLSFYNDTVVPLKEYFPQLLTLANIHHRLEIQDAAKTPAARTETPAKELLRIRNWTQLLTTLSSAETRKILDFEPGKWVRKHFLEFADLFLRKYQQARLDNQSGELEKAYEIVLAVLEKGGVKPLVIELGKTLFDSKCHIARSTAKNDRFLDDAVVGVLRNGFEQSGRGIIQQPEVIINKL